MSENTVFVKADETLLYTVQEVADILKTQKNNVYKLINTGLLPALKIGHLKVRRAALIKFLADYEGYDLTEPEKVSKLVLTEGDC